MNILNRLQAAVLAILMLGTLTGCGGGAASGGETGSGDPVRIATKPMTEQYILGEMLGLLIEQAGYDVEITKGVGGGTSNIQPAMESGEFDLYPEYTSSGWVLVLDHQAEGVDDAEMFTRLQQEYEEKFHMTWVGKYGFNNTFTVAVRGDVAEQYGLETTSDLAGAAGELTFGGNPDYLEREDGFPTLCKTYGLDFRNVVDIDIGLKYQALAGGDIDVTNAFTTDAQLANPDTDLVTLEDDKLLYFGQKVDGVIPYGVVGSTIVINGDPICADSDFPVLLAEFKEFCQRSAHNLFFISVTDHFLEEYKKQGFGWVKNGEEARFHLADYEISGKKGAKMRMNINHARKAGVVVHEYCPLKQRDAQIEADLNRITNEWLQQKKSSMLTFVMGTVGLENPMDKRYFYATDADGKIVAFIVFVPFLGKRGYMADVTRHGTGAPSGVMETILYDAFQVFKDEGIEYGSLGVAPLAGLENDSSNPVEKLLCFAYNHLNDCYGFRDLYRAKEKYSPTEWVPSYYIYLPKIPTPDMFYALVTIQNPHQIREAAEDLVKGWAQRLRNKRTSPTHQSKPSRQVSWAASSSTKQPDTRKQTDADKKAD